MAGMREVGFQIWRGVATTIRRLAWLRSLSRTEFTDQDSSITPIQQPISTLSGVVAEGVAGVNRIDVTFYFSTLCGVRTYGLRIETQKEMVVKKIG